MPKVQVTNAKGLVQIKEGTGVDIQNELAFSNGGGVVLPTSSPTGTSTVLANADSGQVVFMNASSTNTITLPAISTVSDGWHVRIILTATGAVGTINTGNSLENVIIGLVLAVDADGSAIAYDQSAAGDRLTFADGCTVGSYFDICSDGSKFYVFGFGSHASASNKITLAQID
tara:strand:- start:187 stop:705 length:519 start_codon:yes stop_codon:yes gene_type:complete